MTTKDKNKPIKIIEKPPVGDKVIATGQTEKPEYHSQDYSTASKDNQDFKVPESKPPVKKPLKVD